MIIYVDADACPVKEEVLRVAKRHDLPVVLVSNSGLRPMESALVRQVVVSGKADAADDWIVAQARATDLVVTADIPLAARCVKLGAKVLGPTGKPFTEAGIGMALAMRDLKAHLRETGESRGFNPSFTSKDRSRFLEALENLIQEAKRAGRVGVDNN